VREREGRMEKERPKKKKKLDIQLNLVVELCKTPRGLKVREPRPKEGNDRMLTRSDAPYRHKPLGVCTKLF